MNQIYLPTGNNNPLTFQTHAAACSKLTRSSGRKRSSNSRKWQRRTEEISQFANIGLNSPKTLLREAAQIGQTEGMNYSNYLCVSGGLWPVFDDFRLFGKGILRRLQALARFRLKITTRANTPTTQLKVPHYSVTILGAIWCNHRMNKPPIGGTPFI